MARSGGRGRNAFLPSRSHSGQQGGGQQRFSRTPYSGRFSDAYNFPAGGPSASRYSPYPAPMSTNRKDFYSEPQFSRSWSPPYSGRPYGDYNVGPRSFPYLSHYPSSQHSGGLSQSSAAANNSEVLARGRNHRGYHPPRNGGAFNENPVMEFPYMNGRRAAYGYQNHAGRDIASGSRRGRDMSQYLFAEKMAPYHAAGPQIPSETTLKRRRNMVMDNSNFNPDGDRYSNYRRAKSRRIGAHDFGVNSSVDTGRGRYRDRRRGKERPRRSSSFRKKSRSTLEDRSNADGANLLPKTGDGKLDDTNKNLSTHSLKNSADQPSDAIVRRKDHDRDHDSDKDSELGSLCADVSNSEDEKAKNAVKAVDNPLHGMIFGCSSATFHECMRLQLFGLPMKNQELVMRVAPGTKLFLFNFDTKELSGIFDAISHGGIQIQPNAFVEFGAFPAQVKVRCAEQCPNLPITKVKPVIQHNYVNQYKFRFDLNAVQVKELVKLFRREAKGRPRWQGHMFNDYVGAHLPRESVMRGSARRRKQLKPQHPQERRGLLSTVVVPSTNKASGAQESKRASQRARKGRRRRKGVNGPDSLKTDNDSSHRRSGEEAETTGNASKSKEGENISNKDRDVSEAREVIETDNSKNAHHNQDIIESTSDHTTGQDPPAPGQGLNHSKSVKFREDQDNPGDKDDIGVRFVESTFDDGRRCLASGQIEEQLNGVTGKVETGRNVIARSSDSTPFSSKIAGVQGVLGALDTAHPLLNLSLALESSEHTINEVKSTEVLHCEIVRSGDEVYDNEVKDNKNRLATIRGHSGMLEDQVKVTEEHPVDYIESKGEDNVGRNPKETVSIFKDVSNGVLKSVQQELIANSTLEGPGQQIDVQEPRTGTNSVCEESGPDKRKGQDLGVVIFPEKCKEKDHKAELYTCKSNITEPATGCKISSVSEAVKIFERHTDSESTHVGKDGVLTDDGAAGDAVDYEFSTAGEEEEYTAVAGDADRCELPAAGEDEEIVMTVENAVEYGNSTTAEEEEVRMVANDKSSPKARLAVTARRVRICELPLGGEDEDVIITEDAVDYESSDCEEEEIEVTYDDGEQEESVDAVVDDEDFEFDEDEGDELSEDDEDYELGEEHEDELDEDEDDEDEDDDAFEPL